MIRSVDKEGLKRLGKHIKELRIKKDISQEELGFSANVSISQISKIETGKQNTSFSTLIAICKALNITLNEFFDDFDYPVPVRSKGKK